jgi:hypothetical protein
VTGVQSHELLRTVYDSGNPKQGAADLGLSLSLIYKWAEPTTDTGSGATNPLDRIEQLVRSTGDDRIVQWICQRAGGFFIRNPKAVWPHPPDLIPATNQVVQEFADLLAVVASSAADSTVSSQEARTIRARWEDLKRATEAFFRCCEEGNFTALREAVNSQLKA